MLQRPNTMDPGHAEPERYTTKPPYFGMAVPAPKHWDASVDLRIEQARREERERCAALCDKLEKASFEKDSPTTGYVLRALGHLIRGVA